MKSRMAHFWKWIRFAIVVFLVVPGPAFASGLSDQAAQCQGWDQQISGDSRIPATCARQIDSSGNVTYEMRTLSESGPGSWGSDDGTCQNAYTNYDYYRCTQLLNFSKAPDATRVSLCKTWTQNASSGDASYQRLYDTAGCDTYAAEVRSTVTGSIAGKCKTYQTATSSKDPTTNSIVDQYLFSPSCVVSGIAQLGCDSVQKTECAYLGSGSAADALTAVFGSQLEVQGDSEIARGKACVAAAKTRKDVKPETIAGAQSLVDAATVLNTNLKDYITQHGTETGATGQAKGIFQAIQSDIQSACDMFGAPPGQIKGSSTVLRNPLGTTNLPTLIGRVIAAFLSVIGGLSLLVFVYAGVRYLTAAGDSKQIQKSVDTMKYAFIGIAIIMFAYVVSTFFFNTLMGK